MADLPTPAAISGLVALLAPGLIVSAIRTRVITGSVPDFKDRILNYALISVGYFAAIGPFFYVPFGITLSAWLWSLLQYFALPVGLGIISAYAYQWGWSYRIAALARLHLAHHLPASWDYAFEQRRVNSFVIVTLKDGTQVAGLWGQGSFASSSREERDLLLSEVWQAGANGEPWTPSEPRRAILITSSEIRYVELL